MGIQLFGDDDIDVDKISTVEVNTEFAKRFEHNKKREDLHRLEELKKKGLVEDSESDESDEIEEEEDFDDKKIMEALIKIKKKDPILRQKDVTLFDTAGNERGERKKVKKVKPKYLKDVNAEKLMENAEEHGGEYVPDDDDEEEEEEMEEEVEMRKKGKSFVEEQEELRKEVLAAIERENRNVGGDGDGDLLKEKENEGEEDDDDEEIKEKLDEFFGDDEGLDENEMFLKEFFRNKMWIDKGKEKEIIEEEELEGVSEEEEVLEKQEDYEREFNFRFEESKSDRVLGHSRVVEGSVRKETNARKQQRERKKERMELAEVERREEVKRLKNLKRKEVKEKLRKIREVAGFDEERGVPLDEDDLEGDFDPEKFDRKMKKAFGDEYYEAEDVNPEFRVSEDEEDDGEGGLEKPDFDKEDELLGLPKDWDVIKSNDGFLAEREKMKKRRVEDGNGSEEMEEDGDGEEEEEEEDDEDEQVGEGKRKRKRKSKLREALDKELEEELYKLDYEDTIGDLKTRFKYRQVKPDTFKLSAAEILEFDEKELNQYVSLKKLAPYRDNEWKVPKERKEMLLGGLLSGQKKLKKRKTKDGEGSSKTVRDKGKEEVVKAQEEGTSKEEKKLSRSARRRQLQKEKKLPQSRLIAYGKIPASSVKKSKS